MIQKESLDILRHSCAHMMAQAIKELYPEAKFFVGPVVKRFYYDFQSRKKSQMKIYLLLKKEKMK